MDMFYLQNEPLHDSQEVKDRHHAAKEHNNGQGLRRKTQSFILTLSRSIWVCVRLNSHAHLLEKQKHPQ